MNSDASEINDSAEVPRPTAHAKLISGDHINPAQNVPVFNCIVYVTLDAGDGVRARVANLAGLEYTAPSEREALGKIVPAFKQLLDEFVQSNSQIPWIESPAPPEPGKHERLIPVHL